MQIKPAHPERGSWDAGNNITNKVSSGTNPPSGLSHRPNGMLFCEQCDNPFDPVSTRWLCPYCKRKHNCCGD